MKRDRHSGCYGLYKVDFNAFGCRAPGGLEEEKYKITLPFPDLLHQAAVGVTFSYAEKTTTHTKKPQQCIIQKFGPAQMSNGETSICCCERQPGTDKKLILGQDFSRGACRCRVLAIFSFIPRDVGPPKVRLQSARAGCQGRPAGGACGEASLVLLAEAATATPSRSLLRSGD